MRVFKAKGRWSIVGFVRIAPAWCEPRNLFALASTNVSIFRPHSCSLHSRSRGYDSRFQTVNRGNFESKRVHEEQATWARRSPLEMPFSHEDRL